MSKHVLFDETQSLASKLNPPGHLSSTRPPNHTHQFLKPIPCPVIPFPAPLVPATSLPIFTPPLESSTSLDAVAASSASSPGITPSHSPSISESIDCIMSISPLIHMLPLHLLPLHLLSPCHVQHQLTLFQPVITP